MKPAHRRAVETRRLYRFEDLAQTFPRYALREYSLAFFRRLARKIWDAHGPWNKSLPQIDFGAGTPFGKQRVSYCDYDDGRRIELAPGQRNLVVFIHEITHALGFGTHGKGFVRRYFKLLAKYAKCDEDALLFEAAQFKLLP